MTIPDRTQAIFVQIGVAESLIDSINDCLDNTDFDSIHFRERLQVLLLGLKFTRADMKEILKAK